MSTPLLQLRTVGLLGLVLILSAAAHELRGQDTTFKIRVKVDVSTESDTALRSSISSYVNRELRSLGDVESVDDNPHFTLHIIAFTTPNNYGQPMGIAIGTSITEPVATDYIKSKVPTLPPNRP